MLCQVSTNAAGHGWLLPNEPMACLLLHRAYLESLINFARTCLLLRATTALELHFHHQSILLHRPATMLAHSAPFRIPRPLCCSRPRLIVSSTLKSPLVLCCAAHHSHTATLASRIRVVPYFTSPHDPHRRLHLPGEVSAFNLPFQHANATNTPPRTRGSKDRQGGLLSNTLRMAYHLVTCSGGSNQSPVTNIT
jgi:hypothetical protein